MPANQRFVFDTNAVISAALIKGSVSRRAFDKALAEGELLVSVETMCIVSGDKDLLVLHPFRGIPVVTPRSFLDETWHGRS